MSLFKSIKNAFGGSDDDYDVFGQTTKFVNPFSKENSTTDKDHVMEDVQIEVDKNEEYTIDAEFADKAVRLMNEHTVAVIDMLKGSWKKEREELLKKVQQADAIVAENKEKMQANEASRRQAVNRSTELSNKVLELEGELEKLDIEKKSLESRLKAMEVRGDDSGVLNAKIEELNGVIEDLKGQVAERDAEIERRDSMPMPADDGESIEQLKVQVEQRDELIERLRNNVSELEQRLGAADEELKAAEELQKAVEQVEEFKDKKNSEIASLRQQIIDLQRRCSQFDEMRKENIVLKDENENLQKNVEQLEQTAKQNAEVQHRRSIETGNLIDGLKQQLASVSAVAEDFKRKYNSLSADGNEKAANFAKINAERDDARAELKRTQVILQKKQHEAQAMSDAIADKDQRIAALTQQIEDLKSAAQQRPAEPQPEATFSNDPAMSAIDDIDWEDDGSLPPHPGEDPRQLSLF